MPTPSRRQVRNALPRPHLQESEDLGGKDRKVAIMAQGAGSHALPAAASPLARPGTAVGAAPVPRIAIAKRPRNASTRKMNG